MLMNSEIANEFCRHFNLELVKKSGSHITLEATQSECGLLAKRYSIPKVNTLIANCRVKKNSPKENGDYILEVSMEAVVVQNCILTLEELTENIFEEFSIIFKNDSDRGMKDDENQEVEFELEDDDIVYIEDKMVDIGEYIAEYLSLAINPYPKKAHASASELAYKVIDEDEVEAEPTQENPFTVLKDLKHKT